VTSAGLEITPVSDVAEAAWAAVHGQKVHTLVGKTAKNLAFAARWMPGALRKQVGGLGRPMGDARTGVLRPTRPGLRPLGLGALILNGIIGAGVFALPGSVAQFPGSWAPLAILGVAAGVSASGSGVCRAGRAF